MADTKISALTANATPAFEDLLTTIDDPGGTPASRKTTIEELLTASVAAANTSLFSPTGYSLTGSDASPAIDIAGTWNTTGAPTGIKLNLTDTASDAASLLMDLQVGGASRFAVYKNAGAYFDGNLVEFRNSTSAQTLRLYNTYTDDSNYERTSFTWDTNVFKISNESAGTGSTTRTLMLSAYNIDIAGTATVDLQLLTDVYFRIGSNLVQSYKDISFAITNTKDIGSPNRPRHVYVGSSVTPSLAVAVSALPGTPSTGMIAQVSDANAPSVGSTVSGGGAAAALVWYNGSNWTVVGV